MKKMKMQKPPLLAALERRPVAYDDNGEALYAASKAETAKIVAICSIGLLALTCIVAAITLYLM